MEWRTRKKRSRREDDEEEVNETNEPPKLSKIAAQTIAKWQLQARQVSLQSQKPTINIPEGEWLPCRKVTLRKGALFCELEPTQMYSLMEAYERRPHILFANADSDQQLIDFIHAWGPLYLTARMLAPGGVIANSLDACRDIQREMRSISDVLTAFKSGKGEREALVRLIEVQDELVEEHKALEFIADSLYITGDVLDWVKTTNTEGLHEAMDYMVSDVINVNCTLRLSYRPGRGGRQVKAVWNLLSLEDALWWMIWFDEFMKQPAG